MVMYSQHHVVTSIQIIVWQHGSVIARIVSIMLKLTKPPLKLRAQWRKRLILMMLMVRIFEKLDQKLIFSGLVLRNRDLFHLWAVENVFQPKLMKDVLMKLNEQSTNVLNHIHNAADNECLSRGKAVDKVSTTSIIMLYSNQGSKSRFSRFFHVPK